MSCRLTMTLISESQEGNIGEDWKYELDVKVLYTLNFSVSLEEGFPDLFYLVKPLSA